MTSEDGASLRYYQGSRWDRFLGMTAAMTQVPHGYHVPTAITQYTVPSAHCIFSYSSFWGPIC